MATPAPLMPKATAVWLLEQYRASVRPDRRIFASCTRSRIQGDRRRRLGAGHQGARPIQTGQLTREQITAAEADHSISLKLTEQKVAVPNPERGGKKGPRYTPVSRGRTGRTPFFGWCAIIPSSRTQRSCVWSAPPRRRFRRSANRTHWNAAALAPMDPVTLGLATQTDLDFEVNRANKEKPAPVDTGATLLRRGNQPRARRPKSRRRRGSREQAGRQRSQCQRRVRQAQAARRQEREGRGVSPLRHSGTRAMRADPESICRSAGIMDSGFAPSARPGMTENFQYPRLPSTAAT